MRLKIEDIKKGDVFYECEGGKNYKMTAMEDTRHLDATEKTFEGWELQAECEGNPTRLYVTKNHEHYGPKLYSEPAYFPV